MVTGHNPSLRQPTVLMVDPPWPQRKGGLRLVRPQQGRELPYSTLSIADSFTTISALLDEAQVVFLWEIDKYLIEAEVEMQQRGFVRHVRFVWDKGNGIAPAFTVRFSHEYLVWWYRKPMSPISVSERGKHTTVIRAPAREHSRKPDEAYALVDRLYHDSRRIDVFSREPREGWEQWGDEPDYFAEVVNAT